MDVNPLAIFFVKNGSNGDKMLFKYPFATATDTGIAAKNNNKRNKFSVGSIGSHDTAISPKPLSFINDNLPASKLSQFQDDDLSYLLAVKKKLCGDKFELKVNDIRFVGHPVNLEDYVGNHPKEASKDRLCGSCILLFNIVFALKVSLSHDIVNCYHDLSRRLGIALSSEERRCRFLSHEAKIMLAELDDPSEQAENDDKRSIYEAILAKSLIAKHLKKVYLDLCNFGKVQIRLNNWIDISFCLPPKINNGFGTTRISHDILLKGLEKVKPFHTFLLLVDRQELLDSLSSDGSPALRRLLRVYVESPISPFYTLAADADLTLSQVLFLAGHLVYWGKATIIYPVCMSNTYVLSPHVPTARMNKYAEIFQEKFPGGFYHQTLAEYSLPISLRDKFTPMSTPQEQQEDYQKLLWLLKKGLIQQLHTYIYITPQSSPRGKSVSQSSGHFSSARGLATVAEAITEKPGEETTSSCSSFRDELDWQDDTKEMVKLHNVIDGRSPFHGGTKILNEDHIFPQDFSSFGYVNKKNSSSEDVTASYASSSHLRNQPHPALSQSLTPSESDFESVCSDDRSASPGCTTSQVTEESVLQELDAWLTPALKEIVLSTEYDRTLEDLRLFSKLCRYFHGEHHIEEIMYLANINRSQLTEILDKFLFILITVQRVDPSISFGAEPR